MGDKALRGKGLLGVGRQPPKEEMDPTESLGLAGGGISQRGLGRAFSKG